MALPHDTSASARDAQVAVLRRMGANRRGAIAASMSEDARRTTLAGIRARHLADVEGILRVVGAGLDRAYIAHWVAALGLSAAWDRVRAAVDEAG